MCDRKDNKTASTDLKDVKIADPTAFKYNGIKAIDKEYSQHTIEIDDEQIDILIKNMGASELGTHASVLIIIPLTFFLLASWIEELKTVISHRSFFERLQIVRWCKTNKELYRDAKGVVVFDAPEGDRLLYVRRYITFF